jgi:hypothetical protein
MSNKSIISNNVLSHIGNPKIHMIKRKFTGMGNDSSFISITDSNNSRLDSTQNMYLQTEEQIFNPKNLNQNNNYGDDMEFEILNHNLNVLKLPESSTASAKLHVKNGIVKISQNNNINSSQYNLIPMGNNISNEKNSVNISRGQLVN